MGAFLDYCELVPLRLSKERLAQDEPIQPLWILGAGVFGSTNSPSILSVPNQSWQPELIFLGEKWMVDFPREFPNLNRFFSMAEWSDDDIEQGVAVMSWKDGGYLGHMHRVADIAAGMVVCHKFPLLEDDDENYSYLNWIPKAFAESPVGASVRNAIGNSESLKWMMKGTKFDNNMIAIIEIDNDTIPEDHMEGFYDRIITLMVEVEQWM